MSRLTLLSLTLALLIPSALAPAQTPASHTAQIPRYPLQNDTVLFDFENGNYDGWTLSGDCWNPQPATAKMFVDRQGAPLVSGIIGKGYLTTLFKSAATTGKAVSKDFTLDKPFLTFRIGGGYYPKKACLNLVVEGKVVRSETGNDSAELTPAYWDVYALTGKTAHLEIVDATTNPNRGYIMADNIRLTERPPINPQTMLEERGIRPHFLQFSRFFENDEQRRNGRYLHFGVTETQFDHMVDAVWVKMCDKRYEPYPNITIDTIAGYVREAAAGVEKQGEKEYTAQLTELGHQWLIAEAACAWCVVSVKVDESIASSDTKGEKVETAVSQLPENTLRNSPPKAVCSGYSLILRDVTRKAGLTSYYPSRKSAASRKWRNRRALLDCLYLSG